MRKIFTILAAVLLTVSVFAQSPEKMSYQAVVRDADNNLVTNQSVGMQISILQGAADGRVIYTETQTPTSNANGLISLEMGAGVSTDDFSAINWSTGPYFIKTETDPKGGTRYTVVGTSQILSVPYSLYADNANRLDGVHAAAFSTTDHVHSDYAASDHSHDLLPVAYGNIRYDATLGLRTVNVESCVWSDTYDRYEITLKNGFYYSIDDVAVVTISGSASSCPAGTVARQSSVSGKLLVYIVQADGTNRQCSFRFVAYQGLDGY
ncbi:MAG: hypothetical protein ABFS32_20630 [Bacteroidota bacterium]